MKRIRTGKWRFWFSVVFFLCAAAFAVQMSYAAYISRSYVKAVAATNEAEKLFGSNLLYGVKNQPTDPDSVSWLSVCPFTVSDPNQTSITVPIKIYNYLAEDQDRVNQLDVSYIISFQIVGIPTEQNGQLSGYYVNGKSINSKETVYYLGSGGVLTTEKDLAAKQSLPGRLPKMNEYNITIPGSDLGKVSIAVKAARVANESGNYGTDLLYLAARVVPSLASTVQSATVSGEFAYENGSPQDYAAYNYRITLSGASTAVVLKWNRDLLELDPFFEKKYGTEPGEGQVIFNMEPGIVNVQFYRNGNVKGKSWGDLGVTVAES